MRRSRAQNPPDRALRQAHLRIALPLLLAPLLFPTGGHAQWLSPPGEGWIDVKAIYHDTDETFDHTGDRRTIFADGRAITRSLFLTGTVGVRKGVDVWVQAPFHRLRFNDAGGERASAGLGDPRGFVRVGPALFSLPDWPVALRGGVKLNGGSFDVDAEVIPLGEGQRDWEILLELGRSFHPLPLWTMGWIGHRWRLPNVDARREPGDELFWWWTVGGELGPVGWKASVEGLSGGAWTIEGLQISQARRHLHQVFVDLDYPVGPGRLSLGIRTPIRGRNLPAGTAFTSGYFFRWGER